MGSVARTKGPLSLTDRTIEIMALEESHSPVADLAELRIDDRIVARLPDNAVRVLSAFVCLEGRPERSREEIAQLAGISLSGLRPSISTLQDHGINPILFGSGSEGFHALETDIYTDPRWVPRVRADVLDTLGARPSSTAVLRIIWGLFADLDGGEVIANNHEFHELLGRLDLAPKQQRRAVNWLKAERLLVEQESEFFDPDEDSGDDEDQWKYTTNFRSSPWSDADRADAETVVNRVRSGA